MNKEVFIEELKKLNIILTDKQLDQLDTYCKYLLEYNQHTNLTAIKEEGQVYLKHFYDSLTITKVIDLNTINNLLDVGSGAGFPGRNPADHFAGGSKQGDPDPHQHERGRLHGSHLLRLCQKRGQYPGFVPADLFCGRSSGAAAEDLFLRP